MTRAQLTIYALMDGTDGHGWLVRLTEGWRLCGDAPEPIRGWSVLMYRWEPRVAYRGVGEWDHR